MCVPGPSPTFLRLAAILAVAGFSIALTGCDPTRGQSKLTYTTPTLPVNVSFTTDFQGNWTVTAGVATPIGTFSIEHEFPSQKDDTYIVFRDRSKGRDQVFALGRKAYLRIHTQGEHLLDVRKENNKFIIEATTISGAITAELHSEDSCACRVTFRDNAPDMLVTYDRKFVVDHSVLNKDPVHYSLDSVDSIDHVRILGHNYLLVTWKAGLDDKPVWIEVPGNENLDVKVRMLTDSVGQVSPKVRTGGYTSIWWSILYVLGYTALAIFILACLAASGKGR